MLLAKQKFVNEYSTKKNSSPAKNFNTQFKI